MENMKNEFKNALVQQATRYEQLRLQDVSKAAEAELRVRVMEMLRFL